MHPGILVVPGKLLELRSHVYFFSNPGDTVIISAETSRNQDLRGVTYIIFFYKVVKLFGGESLISGATPSSTAVQLVFNPFIQFVSQVELYS